jgi:hypothetical protein
MTVWRPLAETLTTLVGGIEAPPDCGLVVTEADIEIPLEVRAVAVDDRPLLLAIPPHSRWTAGFVPPTHRFRLSIRLLDETDHGD